MARPAEGRRLNPPIGHAGKPAHGPAVQRIPRKTTIPAAVRAVRRNQIDTTMMR
ncbi:hypothetical protein [Nitrospirillum viridazoti]|uniref:hypothetical protein n=1 Tax=Nitrospirillum viridazoti TaxID=3144925 RepID=UPI0003180A14|nr:hypothetical protein [Nitrospirillum amazonense]